MQQNKQKTKAALKTAFTLVVLSSLISCQTVTVYPEGREGVKKASVEPDYHKSEPFFFWGLIGESVVPAGKICKGGKPVQLQSQTTFMDGLIPWAVAVTTGALLAAAFFSDEPTLASIGFPILGGMAALGIYTPKTAKVWCGKEEEKKEKTNSADKPLEAI